MRRITRGSVALKRLIKTRVADVVLTQRHIAERLGVTQQAVSGWANGVAKPGLRAALLIQDAFAIPAADWQVELEVDSGPLPDEPSG